MFGYHVGKDKTYEESLSSADEYLSSVFKHPAAQIFVVGPQSYKQVIDSNDIDNVRKLVDKAKITLNVHGAYVDNPWNKNETGIHNICKELRISEQLGSTGVVVHLGNNTNKTLEYVLDKINQHAPVKIDQVLWLETNSVKPSANSFETPEKLTALVRRVEAIEGLKYRVGICIDTAHLFACGTSLATPELARAYLEGIEPLIHRVPFMFHLNDSASELGSGRDKHAELGRGHIWGGSGAVADTGLPQVIHFIHKHKLAAILERHDGNGVKHDCELISEYL